MFANYVSGYRSFSWFSYVDWSEKKEKHTKMLAVKYTFCWKEEVSYSYSWIQWHRADVKSKALMLYFYKLQTKAWNSENK